MISLIDKLKYKCISLVSPKLKEYRRKRRREERRIERREARKISQSSSESARGVDKEQTNRIIDSLPLISIPTLTSVDNQINAKRTAKEYRNLAKKYASVISDTMAMNDACFMTQGRQDWKAKWENCQGKRILYFCSVDYSGSFYKWAEAVNRHTPHAIRMISLYRHRYGYPVDLLSLRGDILIDRFPESFNEILKLADQADIIHLKDQDGFYRGRNSLPKNLFYQFKKPVVYTFYGGTARIDELDLDYQRYVGSHDAIIAMTPDLCFEWCQSYFVPHNVDEDAHPFRWKDGALIMHTPSTPQRKGTSFFSAAAMKVAAEIGGKVDIITGTKHEYVMSKKPDATIFFDQAGRESEANGGRLIGWYGNSALEAAVFGVPTIAHLSDEALDRAERAGYNAREMSAILNVRPDEVGVYDVLSKFFRYSSEERMDIALKTREWIEKYHSYKSTSEYLSRIYSSL